MKYEIKKGSGHAPVWPVADLAREFGVSSKVLAALIRHAGADAPPCELRSARKRYYDPNAMRRWWRDRMGRTGAK